MDFRIDCPCGSHIMVTEGQAGAALACRCGRALQVPSLKDLRLQAGVAHQLSPDLELQALLQAGRTPCGADCAGCGKSTAGLAEIALECERVYFKDASGPGWVKALLTLPALLFTSWIGVFLLWRTREETAHGETKVYHLPLPVCPQCVPLFEAAKTVRACLREVPLYARLLDKYPKARILQVRPPSAE